MSLTLTIIAIETVKALLKWFTFGPGIAEAPFAEASCAIAGLLHHASQGHCPGFERGLSFESGVDVH